MGGDYGGGLSRAVEQRLREGGAASATVFGFDGGSRIQQRRCALRKVIHAGKMEGSRPILSTGVDVRPGVNQQLYDLDTIGGGSVLDLLATDGEVEQRFTGMIVGIVAGLRDKIGMLVKQLLQQRRVHEPDRCNGVIELGMRSGRGSSIDFINVSTHVHALSGIWMMPCTIGVIADSGEERCVKRIAQDEMGFMTVCQKLDQIIRVRCAMFLLPLARKIDNFVTPGKPYSTILTMGAT